MVTITDIKNSESFVFTLADNRVITARPVFNPNTQRWDFPDVPQDVADALEDVTGTTKFKQIMNGSVPGSLFDSSDHADIDHSGFLGGFFTDGAGTDSAIGKGATPPTAAGSNTFAHGDGSDANGNNSFAQGKDNTVNSDYSFAQGKDNTTATGPNCFVQGQSNTITSGNYNFVQGKTNTIYGWNNFIQGTTNSITYGYYNLAQGQSNTIAGSSYYSLTQGRGNSITAGGSFSQGYGNIGSGYYSFSQGGRNTAAGGSSFTQGATFAQGVNNSVTGQASFAQGRNNTTTGDRCFAQGIFTHAKFDDAKMWGSNRAVLGKAQCGHLCKYLQTTDATANQVIASIPIDTTAAMLLEAVVVGRGPSTDVAWTDRLEIRIFRDAGDITLNGAPSFTVTLAGLTTATVDVNANTTTDDLEIRVTGEAATTIDWVCNVTISEVVT